jgi:hypothetical protein
MPAGDASLERQALKPLNMHGPDDDGKVHADCPKCQASVRRLQAVVDAARRWRELAPECPAPWSSAMHFEHDCKTARAYCLMGAVDEYNAAQGAQSEGEPR